MVVFQVIGQVDGGHATPAEPEGMLHVLVAGRLVVRNGELQEGVKPGSASKMHHVAAAFFVLGLGCSSGEPDRILFNGNIVTLSPDHDIVEAIAIRNGLVMAVGSNDAILAMATSQTAQHDPGGRTVVPGLADNHYHGIGGGPGVDLSMARSMADVLDAIAERASTTDAEDLILTNGNWHEGQLAEKRLPLRNDLDRAAPRHPVVVVRGGHEYILNSAALRRWNIDESTPEPSGGRIGKYADGRLNGELVDRAKNLVRLPPRPRPDAEQMIEALSAEHRQLNAAGLTSVRYAGSSARLYGVLEEMKRRDLLTVRVNFLFRVGSATTPEELDEVIASWGVAPGDGDEWLRVGGVKLGVDGGFEGGWMREPYAEPWGRNGTFHGLQTFPTEPYKQLVSELNRRGWRVATHAVGDAAIDLVLDAYEAAHADRPIANNRWVIEHGFLPHPDQFPRMKALGLAVSAQNHLYLAAPSLVSYWGPERAAWVTPVKAYLDAGIRVSSGTDSPVVPYRPFWTLYHFITRQTISGGVMGADQGISREQALRLSAVENAYLNFEEEIKGTLEPGMIADLIVLSDDFLTTAEENLETMEVVMTMVGGRIVHTGAGW